MKRIILILVLCAMALSLFGVMIEERRTIIKPSSVQSGNENTVPIIATWHDLEFDAHTANAQPVVWCWNCEDYLYFDDFWDYTLCEGNNICNYYYRFICPDCGAEFIDAYFTLYHCYVNGVCDICGAACDHKYWMYDEGYIKGVTGHPLALLGEYPFSDGDSYVVNGHCRLCFMPVN